MTQVATKDAAMSLPSLVVYRPRLLARLLGQAHPSRPSPTDMAVLWTSSPLSRTANFSVDVLSMTSGLWPQQVRHVYQLLRSSYKIV